MDNPYGDGNIPSEAQLQAQITQINFYLDTVNSRSNKEFDVALENLSSLLKELNRGYNSHMDGYRLSLLVYAVLQVSFIAIFICGDKISPESHIFIRALAIFFICLFNGLKDYYRISEKKYNLEQDFKSLNLDYYNLLTVVEDTVTKEVWEESKQEILFVLERIKELAKRITNINLLQEISKNLVLSRNVESRSVKDLYDLLFRAMSNIGLTDAIEVLNNVVLSTQHSKIRKILINPKLIRENLQFHTES